MGEYKKGWRERGEREQERVRELVMFPSSERRELREHISDGNTGNSKDGNVQPFAL